MRSLEMMRSCLPPLTSSPARRMRSFELRLTSTSRLTVAPPCTGMGYGRPSRERRMVSLPLSETTASPDPNRSSSRLRCLNYFRPDNQCKPCTCKGSF